MFRRARVDYRRQKRFSDTLCHLQPKHAIGLSALYFRGHQSLGLDYLLHSIVEEDVGSHFKTFAIRQRITSESTVDP